MHSDIVHVAELLRNALVTKPECPSCLKSARDPGRSKHAMTKMPKLREVCEPGDAMLEKS